MTIKQILIVLGMLFLLTGCGEPNQASVSVQCGTDGVCNIKIVNLEKHPVDYDFELQYEPQGVAIGESFKPHMENAPIYHDSWVLTMSDIASKRGELAAKEEVEFTTTLPADFKQFAGFSLLRAKLTVAPTGFSTHTGRYFAYSAYIVPGIVDQPVVYSLDCSSGIAKVTITNNGLWGDQTFGVYLDENLETPWEEITVMAGDTISFTTKPFPSGARLMMVDVKDHVEKASVYNDNTPKEFHMSRGYCIPGTPALVLDLPSITPQPQPWQH